MAIETTFPWESLSSFSRICNEELEALHRSHTFVGS
jgi:hypothetical protein